MSIHGNSLDAPSPPLKFAYYAHVEPIERLPVSIYFNKMSAYITHVKYGTINHVATPLSEFSRFTNVMEYNFIDTMVTPGKLYIERY